MCVCVPFSQVRGLAGSRGGLVMDVAFDNMISDMRTRRKIQDSLNECQWLAEEVGSLAICHLSCVCVCVCPCLNACQHSAHGLNMQDRV